MRKKKAKWYIGPSTETHNYDISDKKKKKDNYVEWCIFYTEDTLQVASK